jgi:hypothetical protein
MQTIQDSSATIPSAPEWLVSNGRTTVGPVHTDLLLRGVMHGRVPRDSWVKQPEWPAWRELTKIREVSALDRMLEWRFDDLPLRGLALRDCDWLRLASDSGELLLLALHAAAHATSATVGLVHRLREPLGLLTTSCVFEAAPDRLGQVLAWDDPAVRLGRTGQGRVLGAGDPDGPAALSSASSRRLGGALQGLAVFPVLVRGELHALLELGRSDHPFRASDEAELQLFAEHAGAALTRLAEIPT